MAVAQTQDARLLKLTNVELPQSDYSEDDGMTMDWKIFKNLPHLKMDDHNNKYTLGPVLTTREKQGQFIPCEDFPGLPHSSYAEIVCHPDGTYWIKNLIMKGKGTFVNGRKVLEPKQLGWGDIISIGVRDIAAAVPQMYPHFGRNERNEVANKIFFNHFAIFSFQPVTVLMEEGPAVASRKKDKACTSLEQYEYRTSEDNLEGPTLMNHLISSLILSYLPFSSLAACRLVSPYFAREATRDLIKKSKVTLGISTIDTLALLRLANSREMMAWRHPNWRIQTHPGNLTTNEFEDEDDDEDDGEDYELRQRTSLSDLRWFLGPTFQHSVKSLELQWRLVTSAHVLMFTEILRRLAPTLVDLRLELTFNFWASFRPTQFPPEIAFPALQNFSLCSDYYEMEDMDPDPPGDEEILQLKPFFTSLMPSVKTAKSLTWFSKSVPCTPSCECEFCENHSLWTLLPLEVTLSPPGFQNLREISLIRTGVKELELLLKIPRQSLLKLKLNRIEDDEKGNFSQFLGQQCGSLEYLQFKLGEESGSGEKIILPKMERLTVLKMEVGKRFKGKVVFATITCLGPKRKYLFKFNEPMEEEVEYGKHFPALKSLALLFSRAEGAKEVTKSVLKAFFPTESGQECDTLVELDVPEFLRKSSTGELRKTFRRIVGMFPRVRGEDAKRARELPPPPPPSPTGGDTTFMDQTIANG